MVWSLAIGLAVVAVVVAGSFVVRGVSSVQDPEPRFAPAPSVLPSGVTSFVLESRVLFATNSAVLAPGAQVSLEEVAENVRTKHPDASIVIEGYTDDIGTSGYNEALSKSRATTVAAWFEEHAGIPHDRLFVAGHGEDQPVASNDTEDGRQKNRRVVIRVAETAGGHTAATRAPTGTASAR